MYRSVLVTRVTPRRVETPTRVAPTACTVPSGRTANDPFRVFGLSSGGISVREVGSGRLFYTNLGHNEGTWTNPMFKEHLLTGIRWALKLEQGSGAPNPEVSYSEQAKAFAWVVGTELGKNGDELAAKAERAVKADVEWAAKLYEDIDKLRRMDKKKDPDKAKAEKERIFGEIEKK